MSLLKYQRLPVFTHLILHDPISALTAFYSDKYH